MSAQLNSLLQSARMKERSEVKKTLGKEFSYLTQSKSKTKQSTNMKNCCFCDDNCSLKNIKCSIRGQKEGQVGDQMLR